jgi:PAS domain S-box-containing protein
MALMATVSLLSDGAEPFRPRLADPILEPWRWRTFPDLSGLGAECAVEDAEGTLWFGTPAGVWSYDGFRWVNHLSEGHRGGNAMTLCLDREGALYVGGGSRIDRLHRGVWTRALPRAGPGFAEVRKLATASDGSIWAATSWGVIRFDATRSVLHTTAPRAEELRAGGNHPFDAIEVLPDGVADRKRPDTVVADRHDLAEVAVESGGRIWLGTATGEVLRYDPALAGRPEAWTIYNESDGLACGLQPSICPLRDGNVWLAYGSRSQYLHIFDGAGWRKSLLADAGVPTTGGTLVQTRDGVVWLSGRYVLSAHREGTWTTYQRPGVAIPSAQNFVLQTADGALWVGGPGTEVVRIEYQTGRWETLLDLNFQWESPDGTRWFLHRDGGVIAQTGDRWSRFGVADGVIGTPVALIGTRGGEVWVAGSHQGTAATARYDGRVWTRFVHSEFSWGVDWRGVVETSDGSVWFGAAVDSKGPPEHRCGLLQFRGGTWIHHHQPGRVPSGPATVGPGVLLPATVRPEPIGKFLCLGESPDGRIWAGRNLLVYHDQTRWQVSLPPMGERWGIIETLFTDRDRHLWVGTRQFGAFRYDGREWQHVQGNHSLMANSVRSLAQTTDGSIWAATDRGFGRFDGTTWTPDVLPSAMSIPHEGGSLKASASGAIWINRFFPPWTQRGHPNYRPGEAVDDGFWTVAHRWHGAPPETAIQVGPAKIPHPGNLSVSWSGASPWRPSPEAGLRFSHRLDGGPWSPFAAQRDRFLTSLSVGPHRLEVRARDLEFNEDPTPAMWGFVVQPPVWRQPWFVSLMLALGGLVATQTLRVVRERSRLRGANRVLAAEVHDRERAERAARESEEMYRKLIAASPDAITVTDLEGRITLVSPKALELFRVPTAEQALGRTIFEWVSGPDRDKALGIFRELTATGQVQVCNLVLRREDGGLFDAEASAAPIQSSEGTARGLVVISRDLTKHKLLEEQLRQAQKLEAIGQLAAGVAHDFNNLLAVILMQVELTGDRDGLPSPARAGLEEIRQAAERAADLTRQLLLFARKQALQPGDLDLNQAVTGLARMLQRIIGEDVTLRLQLHPTALMIRADAGMLHQVLLNLVVNARDAMPQGGQLAIETGERTFTEADQPVHPAAQPGRYACLRVRDTGTGIPAEIRSRIFDPFFTTKGPGRGTGLGLATVFGIVQQHRGFVEVESQPGRGSCFHVHLPAAPVPAGRRAEPAAAPNPDRGRECLGDSPGPE